MNYLERKAQASTEYKKFCDMSSWLSENGLQQLELWRMINLSYEFSRNKQDVIEQLEDELKRNVYPIIQEQKIKKYIELIKREED